MMEGITIVSILFFSCVMTFFTSVCVHGIPDDNPIKRSVLVQRNKQEALVGHVFRSIQAENDMECFIECFQDKQCLSFNYKNVGDGMPHVCQLNDQTQETNPEDLIFMEDFDFYNPIQAFPSEQRSATASITQSTSEMPTASVISASPTPSVTGITSSATSTTSSVTSTTSSVTSIPSSVTIITSSVTSTTSSVTITTSSVTSTTSSVTSTTSSVTSTTPSGDIIILPLIMVNSQVSSFDIDFPRKTNLDYVILDKMPAMSQFTISLMVKLKQDGNPALISYAVPTTVNELLFRLKDGIFRLRLRSNSMILNYGLRPDGYWHHVAATWETIQGTVRLYVDGVLRFSGSRFAVGLDVRENGKLVLGNDQTEFGGGFDESKALVGTISRVNIWRTVLDEKDILAFAQTCGSEKGSAVSWNDFKPPLAKYFGEAKYIEPSTCKR